MKSLLLIVCSFLCACGVEIERFTIPSDTFIEPELRIYVEVFKAEASRRGVKLDNLRRTSVRFSDQQDHLFQAARCKLRQKYTFSPKVATVSVVRFMWDQATALQREFILTHELGHCLLYRGHSDNPKSFMYPDIPSVKQVLEFEFDVMYDELFTP